MVYSFCIKERVSALVLFVFPGPLMANAQLTLLALQHLLQLSALCALDDWRPLGPWTYFQAALVTAVQTFRETIDDDTEKVV